MSDESSHYTRYNTVHANTGASKLIAALPSDDSKLIVHPSVKAEEEKLLSLLQQLRKDKPDCYFGEIYTKILEPGPIRDNYRSAALYTAHTPIDNRTRYYLQLTLLLYIIAHGRDFTRFSRGEFSYALHEYAFRKAGNRGTIGLLPWAFLESINITKFNRLGLPFGDYFINVAIEELNPPNGEISSTGLLIRQYIDYASKLWQPVLRDGWDFFR